MEPISFIVRLLLLLLRALGHLIAYASAVFSLGMLVLVLDWATGRIAVRLDGR